MTFEIRGRESPIVASHHVPDTMDLISLDKEGDLARFDEICRAPPPAEPRVQLNGKAKNPSKWLMICEEWARGIFVKLKKEDVPVAKELLEDVHQAA